MCCIKQRGSLITPLPGGITPLNMESQPQAYAYGLQRKSHSIRMLEVLHHLLLRTSPPQGQEQGSASGAVELGPSAGVPMLKLFSFVEVHGPKGGALSKHHKVLCAICVLRKVREGSHPAHPH